MYGDAATARDVADDLIARQRIAAVAKANHHTGIALDDDAVDGYMRLGRLIRVPTADLLRDLRCLIVLFLELRKLMQHLVGGHAAKADRRVNVVDAADIQAR
ncbi:hypothetical protein SDC9_97327 [bioreactor metagenome]|uniref:Uncharacterized protein n=1 Tax=bioreactor metagenome TaxID=1076179 RepID=A0A645ABJ4_9ZZZZ